MSYQAVIHNSSNNLVTNQTIGMRISILQGSVTGTLVYVETQTPTSNSNGLVSLEIGGGSILTGSFATINWANGPYYIKTEIDYTGGTNYSISGTTQLLSVPYALYAEKSGTTNAAIDTIYSKITNIEKMLILNGIYTVKDYEGNEYKTVKIGNQLWMAENLKSKKYSDGTDIIGVYAYNNDENNVNKYGRLYKWDATALKNICPCEWHLPSDDEWFQLVSTIDPNAVRNNDYESIVNIVSTSAGRKMKLDDYWLNSDLNNNKSGFSAVPAGMRYLNDGGFSENDGTFFWTSSLVLYYNLFCAYEWSFGDSDSNVRRQKLQTDLGLSIRCVKD